jgi:hypothetical protein
MTPTRSEDKLVDLGLDVDALAHLSNDFVIEVTDVSNDMPFFTADS